MNNPPEGCVVFYDKALWSGLRFSLHPFISNVLDFYRIHSTQITPNAIRMIIIFIIYCQFSLIELRISLFRALFILKKHSYERSWWYFSPWSKYKFGSSLPSFIHDWKNHFFFVSSPIFWGFDYTWGRFELKWNSNSEVLPRDKEAFGELLDMKVPKLSLLVSN